MSDYATYQELAHLSLVLATYHIDATIFAMRRACTRLIGSMISGHDRECYALCLSKDLIPCNRELRSCFSWWQTAISFV
jgi:hypothetical protein